MFKYTYLLSDSYRKEPLPNPPFSHSFSQPESYLPLSKGPLVHDNRLQQLKRQYQTFKSNQMFGPSTAEKTAGNRLSINSPLPDAVVQKGVPDKGELEKRLQRLTTLGERHEEALRQVDLQNKFVAISQKYSRKDEQLKDPFSNDQQNTYFVRTRGADKSNRNQSKQQQKHVLQGLQNIEPTAYFPHSRNSNPSPLYQQQPDNNILSIVSEAKLYSNQPYSKPPAMYPHTNFLQLQNDVTQQSVKTMIDEHLSRAFKPIYPQSKPGRQRFTSDANKTSDEGERGRKVEERVEREQQPRRCREEEPMRYREQGRRSREEGRRDEDKVNSGHMPFSCGPLRASVLAGKGEEGRCKQDRMQSVQKLSSLQEKIKSSIKPYLNI